MGEHIDDCLVFHIDVFALASHADDGDGVGQLIEAPSLCLGSGLYKFYLLVDQHGLKRRIHRQSEPGIFVHLNRCTTDDRLYLERVSG